MLRMLINAIIFNTFELTILRSLLQQSISSNLANSFILSPYAGHISTGIGIGIGIGIGKVPYRYWYRISVKARIGRSLLFSVPT